VEPTASARHQAPAPCSADGGPAHGAADRREAQAQQAAQAAALHAVGRAAGSSASSSRQQRRLSKQAVQAAGSNSRGTEQLAAAGGRPAGAAGM